MAKKGITLVEFKMKAAGCTVYQRGANDVSGWQQDAEWRAALGKARSWAKAAEVLPWRHPLAATAANGGEE